MNNKGQWLILSGMMLAIGLVVLVIILNQAISGGYKVAAAETDFPGREITEIYEETVRTARLVDAQSRSHDPAVFNRTMGYFADNLSRIYAARGVLVTIDVTRHTTHHNVVNITMHYYDGRVNFTLGTTTVPRHVILPVR